MFHAGYTSGEGHHTLPTMPSMIEEPKPKKKKLFSLYHHFEARYLQKQAEMEALAETKRLKVRRRFEYDRQVSRNRLSRNLIKPRGIRKRRSNLRS
jgi:hypothetical protein